MYRLSPWFRAAVKGAGRSQNLMCAAVGITPSHLSRFMTGVAFGPVEARRVERIAETLGVYLPVLKEDLPVEDEAIAGKFRDYEIVYDWALGRAYVGHTATGALVTMPRFIASHGDDARRWAENLPVDAKRVCSVMDWRARTAEKEAAS